MASCIASARCLASPAARTAASAASSARGFGTVSSWSCCRWSSVARYFISWRHVDLQEDNDLAADQALKLASDHRNVGERIRTVDLDETEALGPPTDDGPTNGLLEAGRLLQRCAIPRALDQVGCPSDASCNSPVFSTFSVLSWPSSILSAVTILSWPLVFSTSFAHGSFTVSTSILRPAARPSSPQPLGRGHSPCSTSMSARIREVDV